MHCWSLGGFYFPVDKLFCEWRKPLCSHLCGMLLQTAFGLFDLGSVFWLMQVTLLLDLIFLKENYRGKVLRRVTIWLPALQAKPMLSARAGPRASEQVPQTAADGGAWCLHPCDISLAIYSLATSAPLACFLRLDLLKGFLSSCTWEGCWVTHFIWRPPDCVCRLVTKFPLSVH